MQENGASQDFTNSVRGAPIGRTDLEFQDETSTGSDAQSPESAEPGTVKSEEFGCQLERRTITPSPSVETRWGEQLAEFEHQHRKGSLVSVYEFIGSPEISLLATIPPEGVGFALERLMAMLGKHNIAVDFIFETDPLEAYRFITEELLDELITDVQLPEIVLHFTYEEFHPNEPEDARHWAEEFLHSLFTRNKDRMRSALGAVGPPPGLHASTTLKQTVSDFYTQFPRIAHYALDPIQAVVDGEAAEVEIATLWQGCTAITSQMSNFSAIWKIGLVRSPYSGWDVVSVGWVRPRQPPVS